MSCLTREEILIIYAAQLKEAVQPNEPNRITCICEHNAPIHSMYKCLYCGIWRCRQCAEIHFGKTTEENNKEKGITIEDSPMFTQATK